VTSPQAFEGLRLAGRKVRAPDKTFGWWSITMCRYHRNLPNPDPESEAQIKYLAENAKFFGLEYYDEFDKRQGIVHIIGPEQGFTLPGVTLVAATAIPRPTARSARSLTASARRKSSTCWRRRH